MVVSPLHCSTLLPPRSSRTFKRVDLNSKVDEALYRIQTELLGMDVSLALIPCCTVTMHLCT